MSGRHATWDELSVLLIPLVLCLVYKDGLLRPRSHTYVGSQLCRHFPPYTLFFFYPVNRHSLHAGTSLHLFLFLLLETQAHRYVHKYTCTSLGRAQRSGEHSSGQLRLAVWSLHSVRTLCRPPTRPLFSSLFFLFSKPTCTRRRPAQLDAGPIQRAPDTHGHGRPGAGPW